MTRKPDTHADRQSDKKGETEVISGDTDTTHTHTANPMAHRL